MPKSRKARKEWDRPEGGEPRVVRLAIGFVEFCKGVERALARQAAGLNEHLQDAAASALGNVGEALDAGSPAEIRKFLGYARRSAGEARRLLLAAHRLALLSDPA